jgi:hypothetical protein
VMLHLWRLPCQKAAGCQVVLPHLQGAESPLLTGQTDPGLLEPPAAPGDPTATIQDCIKPGSSNQG